LDTNRKYVQYLTVKAFMIYKCSFLEGYVLDTNRKYVQYLTVKAFK